MSRGTRSANLVILAGICIGELLGWLIFGQWAAAMILGAIGLIVGTVLAKR